MVNPVPTLWVGPFSFAPAALAPVYDENGLEVARSGMYSAATFLGDLSIEWGRDNVWSQPEPSVATCTFWQSDKYIERVPANSYLARIADGTLVGDRFICYFGSGVVPSVRNASGFSASWRFFEGRITNADAKRMTLRTDQGTETGWAIRIQGSDQTGAIANAAAPSSLPNNQTMTQRAAAIRTAAVSSSNIRQMYFEAAYMGGRVKEVDTKDQTAYDLVVKMYESFGHQFAYNPHRNVLIRIPSAYNHGSYSLGFGRRAVGDTVRLYPPRQIDNSGREAPDDSDPYPSGYVGACAVQGDVVLTSEQTQRVTDIQCAWWVSASGADHVSQISVRSAPAKAMLRFDSWFSDGLQVDPIMDSVKSKCLAEGSRACHPAIVWDTDRAGDVPDWETFMSLTLPMQSVRMIVLAGSPFNAVMNVAPVWYPCGGVINYTGGKWKFTVNLAPAPLTLAGTPITFTNLQSNPTGSTVTLDQLDHSISSHDLKYVTSATVSIWE